MQGVVFATGARQYMWYVELLAKTYNAGDQTFYDAIFIEYEEKPVTPECATGFFVIIKGTFI